jgi:hypothetical protein
MFFYRLATRVLQGAMAAATLALVLAPAASADETVSQVVPTGGTITTGTAVSAGDPVQLTITASTGGTVTIVKRTAPARPALKGGPEFDNDKGRSYIGPRFEIRGDATIGKAEFLIDDAALPEPGKLGVDRLKALSAMCYLGDSPGGQQQCSDSGFDYARGQVGDLRADYAGAGEWDLGRHGSVGAGDLLLDLVKEGFSGQGWLPNRESHGLDEVLREGAFPGLLGCTYRCSLTGKVTVSSLVQHALGLKSRVIAAGTVNGSTVGAGRGINQYFTFKLPLKAGVVQTLKRKRVVALSVLLSGVLNGPDGEVIVAKPLGGSRQPKTEFDSRGRDGDSGLLCRVPGITSEDLMVLARKGAKRCP